MTNHSWMFIWAQKADDGVATLFQKAVDLFAVRNYQLCHILRDVCCLALGGLTVLIATLVTSEEDAVTRFALPLVCAFIGFCEIRLLTVHDRLCKRGWDVEAAALYKATAIRHRVKFLPFRVLGMMGVVVLPFGSLLFSTRWSSVDTVSYLTFLIFVSKYFFERCLPHEGQSSHSDVAWGHGVSKGLGS